MLELHTVGYIFHYDIICYSAVNRFQTEQSDRQILYPWATWEALWFLCFSTKNLLWNFLLIPIKTHTHLVFSFLSSQVSVRQYSQSNVSYYSSQQKITVPSRHQEVHIFSICTFSVRKFIMSLIEHICCLLFCFCFPLWQALYKVSGPREEDEGLATRFAFLCVPFVYFGALILNQCSSMQ